METWLLASAGSQKGAKSIHRLSVKTGSLLGVSRDQSYDTVDEFC